MPIFEYSCNSCGKEFETLVRGSSPAPECPACHGTELQKKLSSGFQCWEKELSEALELAEKRERLVLK